MKIKISKNGKNQKNMKKLKKGSENGRDINFAKLDFVSIGEKKYISNQLTKIATSIKDLRVELELSQEELAEMTSVSVSSIKAIEQKKRIPSIPMLLKILYFLDHQRKGKPRECLL